MYNLMTVRVMKRKTKKNSVVLKRDKSVINQGDIVDDLVKSYISEKPKVMYDNYYRMITHDYHVSVNDLPPEKMVKDKINIMKCKHKKKVMGRVF